MKLHLGCGDKKLDGWINCDLSGSDHDCDIRKLPFPDGVADEIAAIHVCEHFYLHEIQAILSDWRRVLKDGGRMILELPCWDKVVQHIKRDGPDVTTRNALYGDPGTINRPEDLHKYCYSIREFGGLLKHIGMRDIRNEIPQFHRPDRDMRWECIK